MTEPEQDQYASWRLAIACLRAQFEAGRKLTPAEMVERSDEKAAALLKDSIMRLRAPDVGAISDAEAERMIAEMGLKHA